MEPTIFNERHHAYLIGLFYKYLRQHHGEQGVACFIKATQTIAEQRGHRMAMRAIRDGEPLEHSTYLAYGELAFVLPTASQTILVGDDIEMRVTSCVWQQVFDEMGLPDRGRAYCAQIDRSIVRGFSPDLVLTLDSTLHDSPCCTMIFHDVHDRPVKPPIDGKKSWAYHCGHYYQGYSRYACAILPDGADIVKQVAHDFAETFGKEMWQTILSYQQTDFESI